MANSPALKRLKLGGETLIDEEIGSSQGAVGDCQMRPDANSAFAKFLPGQAMLKTLSYLRRDSHRLLVSVESRQCRLVMLHPERLSYS